MNFADYYFVRYKTFPAFFNDNPEEAVSIIVTIPCLDDDFIFQTLDSLERASKVAAKIEVIVHVNSGEQIPSATVERNREIFDRLQEKVNVGYYKNFRLLPILTEGTVRKKAGVGFARKIAMDEAVRRFASIDKPDGLIVALDADSLVDKRYFQEIEKAMGNLSAQCFTFQFQHFYDTSVYPENVIHACKLYEIYLRYYRLALKMFNFPFAIHTIGSCFAVRAEAYIKLGGMPPRQGGEDFYFLQKAVKMHPVHEVNVPIVFPSPRISNRVPFGTGPSVQNIIENGKLEVYNPALFGLLKDFYSLFSAMECEDVKEQIPSVIMDYIGDDKFNSILSECRNYSSSPNAFVKRMFDNFDAFFIVKFLNSFNHSVNYPPVDILAAGKALLQSYGIREIDDLYTQILAQDIILHAD